MQGIFVASAYLALTIKDKLYVEKLEEPIDTTAAATEETTVNNSDVVLVKIPANAIPRTLGGRVSKLM